MRSIVPAAGVVAIGILIVAFSNRDADGLLTEAGFNKTKQPDPSQRRSKCESDF
jgi:hypothetical protein